jgi:hypothetical protein
MRTKPSEVKTAAGPGIEAAKLRAWIDSHFEITGVEPLVDQLVELSERLQDVRAELARKPVDCRLVNAEVKLLAQYTSVWKLCGFADPEEPPKRGRPAGPPMQRIRR